MKTRYRIIEYPSKTFSVQVKKKDWKFCGTDGQLLDDDSLNILHRYYSFGDARDAIVRFRRGVIIHEITHP